MGQGSSSQQSSQARATSDSQMHTSIMSNMSGTVSGPSSGTRSAKRSNMNSSEQSLKKEALSVDDMAKLTPDQVFSRYTCGARATDGNCSICMCGLSETSGFCDDDEVGGTDVSSLIKCSHCFHSACLRQMIGSSSHIDCPVCKTIHGRKIGNQPNGEMDVATSTMEDLPGFDGCGTIVITYNFASGIQGPEHPEPGRKYMAFAFPRQAYLPNNDRGKKVLALLEEAWRRRLIFTIGTSVTSGLKNVITWNEIHHKTSFSNYGGHGYPDPHYLDNVTMELALQGVTEDDLLLNST